MASSRFPDAGSASTVVTDTPILGDGSDGDPVSLDTSSLGLVANPLSQFAATTSAQLAGVISNETGSGALVFATSPTLVTPVLGAATGTSISLSGDVAGATFHVGAAAGVDASIVIPAVATITVSKGLITAVV